MSSLLCPDPSERVALKIWDGLTVAKLQLDLVRRSGVRADQSARFDAIAHELEAVAFHVRQLMAHSIPIELSLPAEATMHSDMA